MPKITVKTVKEYNRKQQEILMKYVEMKDDKVIMNGNPFDLIPKEKLAEFTEEMQDFEYSFICKLYGKEYSDEMDFEELSKILKQFKKEYKIQNASFGEVIAKFQ